MNVQIQILSQEVNGILKELEKLKFIKITSQKKQS